MKSIKSEIERLRKELSEKKESEYTKKDELKKLLVERYNDTDNNELTEIIDI